MAAGRVRPLVPTGSRRAGWRSRAPCIAARLLVAPSRPVAVRRHGRRPNPPERARHNPRSSGVSRRHRGEPTRVGDGVQKDPSTEGADGSCSSAGRAGIAVVAGASVVRSSTMRVSSAGPKSLAVVAGALITRSSSSTSAHRSTGRPSSSGRHCLCLVLRPGSASLERAAPGRPQPIRLSSGGSEAHDPARRTSAPDRGRGLASAGHPARRQPILGRSPSHRTAGWSSRTPCRAWWRLGHRRDLDLHASGDRSPPLGSPGGDPHPIIPAGDRRAGLRGLARGVDHRPRRPAVGGVLGAGMSVDVFLVPPASPCPGAPRAPRRAAGGLGAAGCPPPAPPRHGLRAGAACSRRRLRDRRVHKITYQGVRILSRAGTYYASSRSR